jgi:threonyl-tRNA synthetase
MKAKNLYKVIITDKKNKFAACYEVGDKSKLLLKKRIRANIFKVGGAAAFIGLKINITKVEPVTTNPNQLVLFIL